MDEAAAIVTYCAITETRYVLQVTLISILTITLTYEAVTIVTASVKLMDEAAAIVTYCANTETQVCPSGHTYLIHMKLLP